MESEISMKVIGHIRTDFPGKFGIPRQSGLVEELKGVIVLEPEFRNPDVYRGLEGFSHIWILWAFSDNMKKGWSATVRPPRLGGNRRMGVFATRSPFRPNPIGLSCVKLEQVIPHTSQGPLLYVSGSDLMDQTPILDLKPYLPYVDSFPDAEEGFGGPYKDRHLKVEIPSDLLKQFPEEKKEALIKVLAQDPRPSYQKDPERIYGFVFSGFEIHFCVNQEVLQVQEIFPAGKPEDREWQCFPAE